MKGMYQKNSRRTLLAVLTVSLVIAATVAVVNFSRLQRLYNAVTLFDRDVIAENFRSMGEIFDARTVHKGEEAFRFKRKDSRLPETYSYEGRVKSTGEFIERTETTGLVVVKDDTILFEKYYRGNSETSKAISWSVGKSFVSALFGIAISEGCIKSIEQSITDYLPALKTSGYNGVRIKDVLQMSSGIGFNEDYGDFNSDINRLARSFALNTPVEEVALSLKQERKPGTFNHYVSMDTQVLGMVVRAATGRDLSSYLEEKIWKPLGMESDALWLTDSSGMEIALGGLNVTLRDYARFGRLYLNNGNWNGKQIVPSEWIKASITPDAEHLVPGKRATSSSIMGYGYQWWVPVNSDGDFLAIGVYGQAIYINPRQRIVIVKTSAYSDYTNHVEAMEMEAVEMFRAIAENIQD